MHKRIWTPNSVVKSVPGQFLVQGRAIMDARKKFRTKTCFKESWIIRADYTRFHEQANIKHRKSK